MTSLDTATDTEGGSAQRSRPRVSVIIASHNAKRALVRCLARIHAQDGRSETEIIVADSSSDGTAEAIRASFPGVRVIRCAEGTTVPYQRGSAIRATSADIVAVLDPYCLVGCGWLESVVREHAEHAEPVIGGPVALERPATVLRWATYLHEYAAFAPPLPAGPVLGELPGNNLAYKRWALGDLAELEKDGFWKTFHNQGLAGRGYRFRIAPSMEVALDKPLSFADFVVSRYHHGRCFGAMRTQGQARGERWWRALTAPAIPVLLIWRQWRTVWPRPDLRRIFLAVTPLLFLFNLSWTWGEFVGYVSGAGDSCKNLLY